MEARASTPVRLMDNTDTRKPSLWAAQRFSTAIKQCFEMGFTL